MSGDTIRKVDAEGMPIRNCIRCGREITKCFGFVLVRDMWKKNRMPRESCGYCVQRHDHMTWIKTHVDVEMG